MGPICELVAVGDLFPPYGVETCHRTSAEQLVLSADKPNTAAINDAITHYRLFCQLCKVRLQDGTVTDVHVLPDTLERLKRLGYPVPSDADK